MVAARKSAPILALVTLALAPAAAAQALKRDLSDCGLTPCVLFEAGPSLSEVQLEFSAGDQNPNPETGEALEWKAHLRLTQPFSTPAAGAGVVETGLGSVRSAELRLLLTPLPGFDPGDPDPPPEPRVNIELIGALSHLRLASGIAGQPGKVDRIGHALGLGLALSPDRKASLAGRLEYRLSFLSRRQYLPSEVDGSAIRVDNAIVQAGIGGALPHGFGLRNGLNFSVSAAYDFKTHVPGAEFSLSTRVLDDPPIAIGLRGWIQGRDDDPRTHDKLWHVGPVFGFGF